MSRIGAEEIPPGLDSKAFTDVALANPVIRNEDGVVGTISSIEAMVSRIKIPLYPMGNLDPRDFAREKKDIVVQLVLTVFDSTKIEPYTIETSRLRFTGVVLAQEVYALGQWTTFTAEKVELKSKVRGARARRRRKKDAN